MRLDIGICFFVFFLLGVKERLEHTRGNDVRECGGF